MIADLAAAVDPGLVAHRRAALLRLRDRRRAAGGRRRGRLAAAWGQNAALHALSPAAAAAEQVAGEWMLDLLGLPADASFGLPTGAGLGNAVGLAAGRHAVLARAGWDVERNGLYGAPEIQVVIGEEAHATLLTALQYLGLGRERVERSRQRRAGTDAHGRAGSRARRARTGP